MAVVPPTSSRSCASRSRRLLRAAPALAAAALLLPGLLSGCSSSDADGTSDAAASSDAAAVGQCVRDAGYDVADDDFSNPALMHLPDGVPPRSDEADAFMDVVSGCQDSAGSGSLQVSQEDKDAFVLEMIAMAQCLRDEGFENVEDPVDGVWNGPEEYESDPGYQTAIDKCQAGMKHAG